ncbi:hypothetical protein K402DRAFT_417697 [Aulographum hederae CBS 113979]|uniref:Uncharacterized protein n=1 Tax=Aulographum hederae CBS 113979 TaxID=1176131 RepID=A0A6G1HAI1_9PEZI|nr:hypothetical protein K402DRAFT_417697 [Aulographum hederae CBS 113979]
MKKAINLYAEAREKDMRKLKRWVMENMSKDEEMAWIEKKGLRKTSNLMAASISLMQLPSEPSRLLSKDESTALIRFLQCESLALEELNHVTTAHAKIFNVGFEDEEVVGAKAVHLFGAINAITSVTKENPHESSVFAHWRTHVAKLESKTAMHHHHDWNGTPGSRKRELATTSENGNSEAKKRKLSVTSPYLSPEPRAAMLRPRQKSESVSPKMGGLEEVGFGVGLDGNERPLWLLHDEVLKDALDIFGYPGRHHGA